MWCPDGTPPSCSPRPSVARGNATLRRHLIDALALAGSLLALHAVAAGQDKPTPTAKEILAKAAPAEWRTPDPQNLLFMQLPTGRVVIELALDFTPRHAANIRTLVHAHYFDELAIIRVQDNFVTQWGDPTDDGNGDKGKIRPLGKASETLPSEFTRANKGAAANDWPRKR